MNVYCLMSLRVLSIRRNRHKALTKWHLTLILIIRGIVSLVWNSVFERKGVPYGSTRVNFYI